jgi:hypothetical protein
MKYQMVNQNFRFSMIQTAICSIVFFLLLGCVAPEVSNQLDTSGNAVGMDNFPDSGKNQDILRLTYDVAFKPPAGYILDEKGSLHDKGNRYKIHFKNGIGSFLYLTISSTNTENSTKFPYEVSDKEIEKASWKKYYYLPVKDKPNSATISLFACGGDLACARWEWYYNGYLIVFESKGRITEGEISQEILAENYHSLIEKHLLVY